MSKKTDIYCLCDEASEENCTDMRCLKHEKIKPNVCLNCANWKRADSSRTPFFTFTKPTQTA